MIGWDARCVENYSADGRRRTARVTLVARPRENPGTPLKRNMLPGKLWTDAKRNRRFAVDLFRFQSRTDRLQDRESIFFETAFSRVCHLAKHSCSRDARKLQPAQLATPKWSIDVQYRNGNGVTIAQRRNGGARGSLTDEKVDIRVPWRARRRADFVGLNERFAAFDGSVIDQPRVSALTGCSVPQPGNGPFVAGRRAKIPDSGSGNRRYYCYTVFASSRA